MKRKAQASSGLSCIEKYSEGAAQSATQRFAKSDGGFRLRRKQAIAVH